MDCGCDTDSCDPEAEHINFCPLHAAAGEMRELLEEVKDITSKKYRHDIMGIEVLEYTRVIERIKDVLERTKG